MQVFQRGLFAISLAVLVAVVLRIRGAGGIEPNEAGWRQLEGPEFR